MHQWVTESCVLPAVVILFDLGGKYHDFISTTMHMVKEYLDVVIFKKENIYFYILKCVCPYVCTCVYVVYACCMCASVFEGSYVHVCMCMYCLCVYMCAHVFICVLMCVSLCVCMCACMCVSV